MRGSGTFFDARLNDPTQYPLAVKDSSYNVLDVPDLVTPKLAALHFYQSAIPAPTPPEGSYDQAAAIRGKVLFGGKGKYANCHVPPLYMETGNNLQAPSEIRRGFFPSRQITHTHVSHRSACRFVEPAEPWLLP